MVQRTINRNQITYSFCPPVRMNLSKTSATDYYILDYIISLTDSNKDTIVYFAESTKSIHSLHAHLSIVDFPDLKIDEFN